MFQECVRVGLKCDKKNQFKFLIDSARFAKQTAGNVCIKVEINEERWFSFLSENFIHGLTKTSLTMKTKTLFSMGTLPIYFSKKKKATTNETTAFNVFPLIIHIFFWGGGIFRIVGSSKIPTLFRFKRHDIFFRLRIHFLTR